MDWQAGYRLCCWDRPWAKDEACGEYEIDTNGFLNPLGTLNLRGQPHCARPPARLQGYNIQPSSFPFPECPVGGQAGL